MKTLTLNYLMVVWAWGLYLNHHFVSSILMLMVACLYLIKERGRFNYLRMILAFGISFLALNVIYSLTDISSFYRDFDYFSTMLCLNLAESNEVVSFIKKDSIIKISKFILSLCVLFNLITLVLPNAWYTIFSKLNIYVLIAFIFSPELFSLYARLLVREFNLRYKLI